MLVGGARDAPERQRTLRATIDWSYDLLTSEERSAFAHMAVFAGGATVTAAETVTGASLDTLDSLVAKQLLARHDERLLMLETVREYALERLAEDPDGDGPGSPRDLVRDSLAGDTPSRRGRPGRGWPGSTPSSRTPAALSWALEQGAELALQLVGELATTGGTRISPKMLFAGSMLRWTPPWEATPSSLACEPARCSTEVASRMVRRSDKPYRDDLQASLSVYRSLRGRKPGSLPA